MIDNVVRCGSINSKPDHLMIDFSAPIEIECFEILTVFSQMDYGLAVYFTTVTHMYLAH